MAQDIDQLLQHLSWDKVHLVGNSLGGMIAQEFALLSPHKLLSLTLIATHAGGLSSIVPPWQMFASFLRHPFGKSTREQMRSVMGLVFSEKFLDLPGKKENFSIINGEYTTILDFYLDLVGQFDCVFVRENPVWMFLKQLSAVMTHSVSFAALSLLKDRFPTLVVVGTGDKIIHPTQSDKLHGALGGHLLKFEGAGHAVTEECLDAVNSALHKHFSQVPCL